MTRRAWSRAGEPSALEQSDSEPACLGAMSDSASYRMPGPELPPQGVVVVAHGGEEVSTEPVTAAQLAVLRMIPVAGAIRHALTDGRFLVLQPRFTVRGWNGDAASPVVDLLTLLDGIRARHGDVPVTLIGHSMGGRAALRVAGHPLVHAVAALAPWIPPGEPAAQVAGRRLLLAHGNRDMITSPRDTWAFAERAREFTPVTAIEVQAGEHTMLRRGRLWHALAAEFARASFGLAGESWLATAVRKTDAGRVSL
jgi:pimeloyl-ACP methyl ester carboxylesterase